MFVLENIVRKNILNITPYSSARDDFSGKAEVFLDANESPFDTGLNRYPHPRQPELRKKISELKNIPSENIILGNGSDELLDLLFRVFCEPKEDSIITLPPTYGMYKVLAATHDVKVREINLTTDFQPDVEAILNSCDANTKMIFVCSPNNPTGNSIEISTIEKLLKSFSGLVVVDEAYIDFSEKGSVLNLLAENKNLAVLQTFSKAWGMAAVRLGIGFASTEIIGYLNRVKLPYNVNELTAKAALESLSKPEIKERNVQEILQQRKLLAENLLSFYFTEKIFPSDANFLLVKFKNARAVYVFLAAKGIIVRDRSKEKSCEQCLRITVGTEEQNKILINALCHFEIEISH